MDVINSIVDKLGDPKSQPLQYIRKSASKSRDVEALISDVFKLMTSRLDSTSYKQNEMLKEIFIQNFESEQIWQQIELKNKLLSSYVPRITKLLLSKTELAFPYFKTSDLTDPSLELDSNTESKSELVTIGNDETLEDEESSDDESLSADLEDSDNENIINDTSNSHKKNDSSVCGKSISGSGDMFFNLNEMESFLEKAEKESLAGDSDIDYFTNISDNDNDEAHPIYKDFFEDPQSLKTLRSSKEDDDGDFTHSEGGDDSDYAFDKINNFRKRSGKNIEVPEELHGSKKVRFLSEDKESNEDSDEDRKSDIYEKSSFEKKDSKLKEQIAKMEESALNEKPWPQRGEVDGQQRPINSLLEEIVDVDLTSRPAPVMTENVTNDLETIIVNRIKNRAFDDVEKKIKPVHVQHELKKELVLNQEKSKVSLAQIYEQEYLSKHDAVNEQETPENKEMTEQKEEILRMMKSVFRKLDTLSNFHYTPKPVIDELKIISNTPAISVEEALPVAVSEGSTLAPQEIAGSKKKVLIGKDERTKTDKQRERRKKKAFLAKKLKKTKNKVGTITKVLKSKNVSLVEPAGKEKAIKSSTKFFTQLQENAESGFLSKKRKDKVVKPKPHK